MKEQTSAPVSAISHIEEHLPDSLSLEEIAEATNYSKYHLHRRFAKEAGLTIGDYICRRRLTEAAKMLVFTDWPILDVAVSVGFGSQQAFSAAFKRMFKKTPSQYRSEEEFWPLQSKLLLSTDAHRKGELSIRFATFSDEEEWMSLLRQVVDGYPHLNEGDYREQLRIAITRREALVCLTEGKVVGTLAFSRSGGTIDFLGILQQYRGRNISKLLLRNALDEISSHIESVTTTTFRDGDSADTGWRRELLGLGFAEGEFLVEFGYPTQRLWISREVLEEACDVE